MGILNIVGGFFFVVLSISCKDEAWKWRMAEEGGIDQVMQPQLMAYPQGNLQDLGKRWRNFPGQKGADW